MLRAAVALTALLAVACGEAGPADVERDSGGRPTEAGTVRADKLRPGDCFDDQDDQSPDGFPVVPCGRPHANEAFHRFVVAGNDYPGEESLTDQATARCGGDPFTDFVGRPVEGSSFDVFFVLPSEDTWERHGDRIVVCALFARDLEPLTGSVEGSAR